MLLGVLSHSLAGWTRHLTVSAILTVVLARPGTSTAQDTNRFREAYLGQASPGCVPVLFAPEFFTDPGEYHSPIVFSPEGTEAYWSPMPGHGRNTTLMTRMVDGAWTEPRYVDFGLEAGATEVAFSPDGTKVYFLSTQLLDGEHSTEAAPERIWYVDRNRDGSTGPPQIMPRIVTDHPTHWRFAVAASGNLYFNSRAAGGDNADIYVAPFDGERYAEPRPLGIGVNSADHEHCPYVAPDESYLLFTRMDTESRESDLFVSYRSVDGSWSEAEPLPPPINSQQVEVAPVVSPDGKYLFFLSHRQGAGRIFWVEADFLARNRTP